VKLQQEFSALAQLEKISFWYVHFIWNLNNLCYHIISQLNIWCSNNLKEKIYEWKNWYRSMW
jgi:hypothetical protein